MLRIAALAAKISNRNTFKALVVPIIKVPEACQLSRKSVATSATNNLTMSQFCVSIFCFNSEKDL